jgi:hypothetical protein
MDKLDILNAFYYQDKYAQHKCCDYKSTRVELVVKAKEHLHPSKYFLDDATWKYHNLEELVKEPELQKFVTDYLAQDFKKKQDPSHFVYETWTKKVFNTNDFQTFSAVYFPQSPRPTREEDIAKVYKRVLCNNLITL